jgi:hypothetical protein
MADATPAATAIIGSALSSAGTGPVYPKPGNAATEMREKGAEQMNIKNIRPLKRVDCHCQLLAGEHPVRSRAVALKGQQQLVLHDD